MAQDFDVESYELLPKPVLIVVSSCRVRIYLGNQFLLEHIYNKKQLKKIFVVVFNFIIIYQHFQTRRCYSSQLLQPLITISIQTSKTCSYLFPSNLLFLYKIQTLFLYIKIHLIRYLSLILYAISP